MPYMGGEHLPGPRLPALPVERAPGRERGLTPRHPRQALYSCLIVRRIWFVPARLRCVGVRIGTGIMLRDPPAHQKEGHCDNGRPPRTTERNTTAPTLNWCAPPDSNPGTCGLRIRCSTVELGAPGQLTSRLPRRQRNRGVSRPSGHAPRSTKGAGGRNGGGSWDRRHTVGRHGRRWGGQSEPPRQPRQGEAECGSPEREGVVARRRGFADLHPGRSGQ